MNSRLIAGIGLGAVLAVAVALAQSNPPAQNKTASLRPVVGRSVVSTQLGIVAASHPLAARAGVEMLERGGNAPSGAAAHRSDSPARLLPSPCGRTRVPSCRAALLAVAGCLVAGGMRRQHHVRTLHLQTVVVGNRRPVPADFARGAAGEPWPAELQRGADARLETQCAIGCAARSRGAVRGHLGATR